MNPSAILTPAIAAALISVAAAQDHAKTGGHAAAPAATEVPPAVTPSAEGTKLYFINLKDGDTIPQEYTVLFGLKGMGIAPAGIYFENTGHHHLLINMGINEIPEGTPIPTIEGKSLHFGKGQTETDLKLPPGKHTLQLILGNYSHLLHDPPVVSEKITVTVEG